jgi:Domain of unknown function (DUF1905)/Bacteriocin-protection, YdeI or OmpD-Associated
MQGLSEKSFSAKIGIIGVNPFVFIPGPVLRKLFSESRRHKSPIPVRGTINGNNFIQTLVKFRGKWRLYLNTPMRKQAGIDTGEVASIQIEFDPDPRVVSMHPKLKTALAQNKKAKAVFANLAPYRKKEIVRYISALKSEESVDRNVFKAIQHLLGKMRFAGHDAIDHPKITNPHS